MIQDLVLQSLSTLEVKDSDLEATLAALEAAVQELGCLSDVQPERAAAETAREELQQRVAAQQALEDTMASVRRISTSDGTTVSRHDAALVGLHQTLCNKLAVFKFSSISG